MLLRLQENTLTETQNVSNWMCVKIRLMAGKEMVLNKLCGNFSGVMGSEM
jgi:hypothetical protein